MIAGVERLPEGYHRLYERAVEVLEADERFRAMWLGGSIARGTADAGSDLDVLLAVADDAHDEVAASWPTWLAAITPTVLAREQPWARGCFWSFTPGYERFDVVIEKASAIPSTFFRTRAVVFDRDGLDALVPPPEPGPGPSPERVGQLVESWFHFSGMLEVVLVREDWLLAAEHLHLLADLVHQLHVEANAPLPPMGLKQWSTKLTPAQRAVELSLPRAATSADAVRHAHLAMARAFLTTARPLAAELGAPWPDELEAAATAHLRDVLGVDDPYPGGGSRQASVEPGSR